MAFPGGTPSPFGSTAVGRITVPRLDFVRSSWDGSERLWKVFWIYGVMAGTAIGTGVHFASKVLSVPELLLVTATALSWALWVTVSLWRCAFNSSWRGWGYGVRAGIVLGVTAIVVELVGALPDDDVV